MLQSQPITRLKLFILLSVLLSGVTSIAQATTIINDDSKDETIRGLEYWISAQSSEDSAALPASITGQNWQEFVHVKNNEIPIGGSLWLRFTLQSTETQLSDWYLAIRMATLQRGKVYTVNAVTGEHWNSKPIGLLYPFVDRYIHSRHLAFPISLVPNESLDVYVEFTAVNLVTAPLMLTKKDDFLAHTALDLICMGLVIGSLIIMLLYNFSIFTVLREPTYFYYSVFVLSSIIYVLYLTGIAPIFMWPDDRWMVDHGVYIFAGTTFLAATIFIRVFLDFKHYGGWILLTNNIFVIAWSACVFLLCFFESTKFTGVMGLLSVITSVVGLSVSIYLALQKNRLAIIYLFAWSFLMVGTTLFLLMMRGVLEYNIFTTYSQMAGMVFELVVLSFALAYRMNQDRAQRELAQKEALILTDRVSKERRRRIVAQEETLSLQKNINEKLEEQVEIRTHQYEEAMDKLEVANSDLLKLSLTDQLSQVYNRRAFDESIAKECSRARRDNQNLSVILVDIDHFKNVNDTYGHTFGDACIKAVATTLASVVNRSGDMLARYGGEEFIFLLPNTTEEDALVVAEKARASIEAMEVNAEGMSLKITASFGVASWVPTEYEDDTNLVKEADKALYVAKDDGRNCVRIITRDHQIHS